MKTKSSRRVRRIRRYDYIVDCLETKRTYSHKELIALIKWAKPNLSDSSCRWTIDRLIREGKVRRKGYDAYSPVNGDAPGEYYPCYSDEARKLMKDLSDRFPDVAFTVFETALLNEFLNHLIARNTIFVQVERGSGIFLFRYLQEKGYGNVLYKPSENDLALYWSKGCVVVTDLVSEAPMGVADPHAITLEKMLVDIFADKRISSLYGKGKYPDVIEQAQGRYLLDGRRMLRYARRRNRHEEIGAYLERR